MNRNPRILLALAVLVLSWYLPASLHAQSTRLTHSITRAQHQPPALGRDYWFALMENSADQSSGKYFELYVTSARAATVHVRCGTTEKILAVQPFQSAMFSMPLAWEMRRSGSVEDNVVHVWCDSADIACSVMSHIPYSSDGMTIIPSIGWGKEYVVAGYASLFEGFGHAVYDFPSEFAIVANQDNTVVTITPTVDIRAAANDTAGCDRVFANKGVPTQIRLNKGQCMQFKTTCTQNCDEYDLTGTSVLANNPIGLIAGSTCANIPCDFPYCDHVCEMIPPVRTWGMTYYTFPFYQQPSMPPAHSASTFLVIGTKKGQKIYRFESSSQQSTLYCQVGKYETYWRNDIAEGSRWTSSAPFLLVQYMNSASYPDNQNGKGDPSEVSVPSIEMFPKSSVFQIPASVGSQTPYDNYVNIIANENDKNILLDGKPIGLATRVYIDGKYTCYRVTGLKTGGHVIVSDSGTGVYVYGYGDSESYGWSGPMGIASLNPADTIAPIATVADNCFQTHVVLADTGKGGNGLYYLRMDSAQNISFSLDPKYQEGVTIPATYYDLQVIDPSKPGVAIVSAFDTAGNRTTITTTYDNKFAYLSPVKLDFGTVPTNTTVYRYDTIFNQTPTSYTINGIHLVQGGEGFTIDSIVTTPLAPGEKRLIKIAFAPTAAKISVDTLLYPDNCGSIMSVLTGVGTVTTRDFYITNLNFAPQPVGASTALQAQVVNLSTTLPITIDSMWTDDPVHFIPSPDISKSWVWIAQKKDSLTIPVHGTAFVNFIFHADTAGTNNSQWYAHSADIQNGTGESGTRTNTLRGTAVALQSVATEHVKQNEYLMLSSDGRLLRSTLDVTVHLELLSLVGSTVLTRTIAPNAAVDVSSLAAGVYLYRLTEGQRILTGKIEIP